MVTGDETVYSGNNDTSYINNRQYCLATQYAQTMKLKETQTTGFSGILSMHEGKLTPFLTINFSPLKQVVDYTPQLLCM